MTAKKRNHVERRLTDEERSRHSEIRAAAINDFPPKQVARAHSPPGIPTTVRAAREAQGLTWHALAKMAEIDDQSTIRDIERGEDVRLSDLQRVAGALGLQLELVEQVATA